MSDDKHEHPPQQNGHDLGFELPPPAKLTPTRAVLVTSVVVVVLAGAFLAAYLPRRKAQAELTERATESESAVMRVKAQKPKVMSSDRALVLPGTISPLASIVVYSRANGYVKKWAVDIGDRVAEGQVLAELETPELDQQISQARAQIAQAEASVLQAVANAEFSKANLDRYNLLSSQGLAAQQDVDKQRAQAKVDEASVVVAKANVQAMQSNLGNLEQLKGFARVTAPFAGTITTRSVDVGALVTAGSSPGSGTALFTLVSADPVRVFIQVPQDVAPSVRAGANADVTVREYPGKLFHGTITRAAGALDTASRTMNTEVRVPNPDNALLTGMYAEVALTLPNPHKVYELPATALFNDAHGLRLATVGADHRVKMVKVVMERDVGSTVLISSGIEDDSMIIDIARADISDGTEVEIVK
jgi:RND family efflux transporter MFP subunit